jgi:membrane associated rhomboid family serine protease
MADRYRYRQYRFQPTGFGPTVTPMVKNLMIANAAIFLLQMFADRSMPFTAYFAVTPVLVFDQLAVWQPFTYMWLHGSLLHLFSNMLGLWMFGGPIESAWGSRRFLTYYLQCGIGAGLIILAWNWWFAPGIPTLGASGAVYGVLLASSLMWPDRTVMLMFPPVPLKAIWLIPVLFLFDLTSAGSAAISHIGHLGGVIVGGWILRERLAPYLSLGALRHRYHRWRMRNRLRTVRRDEWQRRNSDDGPGRPH